MGRNSRQNNKKSPGHTKWKAKHTNQENQQKSNKLQNTQQLIRT
jgi:hypothetical protein